MLERLALADNRLRDLSGIPNPHDSTTRVFNSWFIFYSCWLPC